ncbi:MAG: HAMP domain-containing histidine kinase, partial [Magnetococcales bacterium]|nr:HAMP domain-containing histidine kinase [Magnetococcales bacterium]
MNALHTLLIECARISTPLMDEVLHLILEQQAKLAEKQLYDALLVELIGQLVESERQLAHHKETLEEQNRKLIELDRIKQDVDLIARHDLKSPLNGILGCADLLLDSSLTGEQRSRLLTIRKAGMSALHMVNLSLGLYRMEQGTYRLEATRIDLLPVLYTIRDDLRALILGNELKFLVEIDHAPAGASDAFFILGEELLCYSLFANLIKNALEAAPPSGTVRIMLRNTPSAALIGIHNPGAVPEEMRASFFDKYATSGKSSGTGLGTYSARLICETMGGRIGMRSSQAHGTLVAVGLPSGSASASGIGSPLQAMDLLVAFPESYPIQAQPASAHAHHGI